MVIGVTVAAFLRRGGAPPPFTARRSPSSTWPGTCCTHAEREHDFVFGTEAVAFSWQMGRAAFVGLGQNEFVAVGLVALAVLGVVFRGSYGDGRPSQPGAGRDRGADRQRRVLRRPHRDRALGRRDPGRGQRSILLHRGRFAAPGRRRSVASGSRAAGVVLGAIPVVLLALAFPTNVDLFRHAGALGNRDLVVAGCVFAAHSGAACGYPPLRIPDRAHLGPTAGFLRRAAADGRLARTRVSPEEQLAADVAIACTRPDGRGPAGCPVRPVTGVIHARRGTRIEFSGVIAVSLAAGAGVRSRSATTAPTAERSSCGPGRSTWSSPARSDRRTSAGSRAG